MFALLLSVLLGCGGGDTDTGTVLTGEACQTCHNGIEPIHEDYDIACTFCHGGDATSIVKEDAHVAVPDNYWEVRGTDLPPAAEGYIKDMTPNQLDALGTEYVKFINPGDIRAVDETCGTCHPDQAATVKNSIMTTNAGHYMPTRFLAGFQDRLAIYGAHPAEDLECDPDAYVGTVCSLETLEPDGDAVIEAALADGDVDEIERIAYDHYLAKSCDTCHAAGYGKNNSPYLYRSTGCSACHVVYGKDGVYEGGDQAVPHNLPVYPKEHRITTAIPTEQCATCHFQGGRIGLLYRGIRENGFSETPENAEPWNESAYGHTAGYYLLDEDTTNDFDDSPPDIHYELGMHCVDCHVGSDVHGDGRLYSTSKFQVDIKCEDCHGTIEQRRQPDAAGIYKTSSGRSLPQLSTDAEGQVVLTGKVDGAEHITPQIADLLGDGGDGTAEMHRAMARDSETGFTHTESLTCDTCHTSYNLFCLGCHVSMDMRLSQIDHQTGKASTGLVRGSRQTYMLDQVLLGTGFDGRVQTVNPSQQVQMSVFDYDGEQVFGGVSEDDPDKAVGSFRMTEGSDANIGFAPFFQHTTTNKPRTCETCHRKDDSAEELARVRGVYGFGTGEVMLENPDGPHVDVLQFLDDDGNELTEWTHVGTGPVSEDRRNNALSIILEDLE